MKKYTTAYELAEIDAENVKDAYKPQTDL